MRWLWCFVFLVLAFGAATAQAQQVTVYPDIRGVWAGAYSVAFARGVPNSGDQAVRFEMELEVYRMQDKLIWALNRWRQAGSTDWVEDTLVGTFHPDDTAALTLVQGRSHTGTRSSEPVSPGTFRGRVIGESLYLVYVRTGTTFSVVLSKKE